MNKRNVRITKPDNEVVGYGKIKAVNNGVIEVEFRAETERFSVSCRNYLGVNSRLKETKITKL